MASKTQCPVTRKEFLTNASPLSVRFGQGGWTNANPKHYATESVGWCLTGKVAVRVGDYSLGCQVSLNATCVGSKDLPAEAGLLCPHTTGQVREDLSACDRLPSKAYFTQHAKPLKIALGNDTLVAYPRAFSSGKLGWYYGGKSTVDCNGTLVKVQVGISIVGIGTNLLAHEGIPIMDTTPADSAEVATLPAALVAAKEFCVA